MMADEALRLAIKLAVDAGDYERAGALLDVARRTAPKAASVAGSYGTAPCPAVSSTFVRRGNRTRWTASVRSTAERPGRQLQLTARFLGIRAVDNSAPDPVPVPLRRSSARKSSGSSLGSAKPPRSTPFKIGRLSIRTC